MNYPDYKNDEEIKRYLDYTRMIVRHFKGRIQYYEILNEALFYVDVVDYTNLIRRTVPVIREEDPQAKIVVGGSSNLLDAGNRDYLFRVLRSGILPLVDGIAMHPLYGASPEYDDVREYYYGYPSLVEEIKDVASANGFTGEFFAEEMCWRTSISPNPYEPWEYSRIVAAKYYARGILINRGLDFWAGLGGESYDTITPIVNVVHNIGNVLVEASPKHFPVEIQSDATDIVSYTFVQSNGDHLMALWTDGVAVDEDPGMKAMLIVRGFSGQTATGIDILRGFEQQLITSDENENLVIRDLLVKDYPTILRFTSAASP